MIQNGLFYCYEVAWLSRRECVFGRSRTDFARTLRSVWRAVWVRKGLTGERFDPASSLVCVPHPDSSVAASSTPPASHLRTSCCRSTVQKHSNYIVVYICAAMF